jgi:predicted CXXCH cytochrome family protein
MGTRAWLRRLLLLAALAGGAGGVLLYAPWRARPPIIESPSFALPPISASPFLNTRAGVGYIGSARCRSCHAAEHASFAHTGMGRSMALVDLAREPGDAAFDHPPSKRRYEVVRRDGQMIHRELLRTDATEEIVLSEYPVAYVVGSGRHSLTYLALADGFLVESPITWYRARNGWGMSPGYDRPEHDGFERAVGTGCLMCHAGDAQAVDGSLHRMHIREPVIGCERCHGPGALHVEDRNRPAPGTIDYTIVNPAHLSRELAEAICQQCHLRTSALVVARGRALADYRPGLPLADFRHDFRLQASDRSMTVVGHVEQMHLSRCYQGAATFSCLTCHDPHGEPAPAEREAHFRAVCLRCHDAGRCKATAALRQQHSPSNSCIACHMPAAPTEILHLAFTHHRVGIHDLTRVAAAAEVRPTALSTLEPFLDQSRLSEIDRTRSLGMGYVEVAKQCKDPALANQYAARAMALLGDARARGLRDGGVDAALARLRFATGTDSAASLAEAALADDRLDPHDRCDALFLVADGLARAGYHREAIPKLRELATLRRHSVQMLLLADCQRRVDDPGYVETLQQAVRINPRLVPVHAHLAEHYRGQGDPARAEYHRKRAVP